MITVFGASGNTGGVAAARLLKSGQKVRVVGRQREKLAALTQAGGESCVGNVEDAGFVKEALAGAEAAYVLIPPNMAVDDFRAYQMRVVDALASGVEAAGLRHVVLLSSIGAHHSEGTGPIVALHQFENRLKKIAGLSALFLRAGFFMENILMGLGTIKAQGIYGAAMPADVPMPIIASSDIGAYAALRLERLDFSGKSAVHLVGPRGVTNAEAVAIIGQAIDKPIRYVQISLEDLEQGLKQAGLKPSLASLFIEMNKGAAQGLLAPEAGGTVVATATTFETFVKEVLLPAYRR
jgi:uncharacterized protein YbjT (DUF2867 family)